MDSAKETRQKEISAYLDRIEKLENGTAMAVFLIEDEEEEEFYKIILPTKFLPEDADEGEYLTLTFSRAED